MLAEIDEDIIKIKTQPFRFDLIHPVDLVEEIGLGYGIQNLQPTLPGSNMTGGFDKKQQLLTQTRDVLTGLGLIEIMTIGLISQDILDKSNIENKDIIKVVDTKSIEHEILKNSNIPGILKTFSRNIHKKYPQRIFEISKIFLKDNNAIKEQYNLTVGLAHATVNFTEASSYLNAVGKQLFNIDFRTTASENKIFLKGRVANIFNGKTHIGIIGEIHPQILENFAIRTPVVLFDINLEELLREKLF